MGTMQKLVTAKMMYVLYVWVVKMSGVTRTTMKFESQLAAVASAFAGPRMLSGMISTAHIQLMPCQPIEKTVKGQGQ